MKVKGGSVSPRAVPSRRMTRRICGLKPIFRVKIIMGKKLMPSLVMLQRCSGMALKNVV